MKVQYLTSTVLVLVVATICFFASGFLGYRVVALILLMTTSIIAMLFDIFPVLTAAVLSSMIWNFFFIPPLYTFHIDNAEDVLMFLLYFFIALLNGVLTFKIRQSENKSRDKEEKENTIKLYNTLLNSLSHELRTPISTIIGAVDMLKENKSTLTANNQNNLLTEIDKATIRLNRQVENLLSMSRLESGMLKPKFDWCDLNELINSVIQKISSTNNHKIVFHINENLPLFKLDNGLIEQVLHNLIHNAIQYTPEKSIIEVDAKHQSNYCMITVSDNGKGFPENEIPFAFDKFYRLPKTKSGGSGLGLSIAKGFVEAHNGTIKLENYKKGGAKFTIEIPAETSFLNSLKNE
jgi:two-component system sensor histidine kinase KdpD